MPRLDFSHIHCYESRLEGITLPLVLRSAGETVDLLAHVDTGASNCLFEREHGEMLNLDIEAGDPKAFSTATGHIHAFGHMVSLEALDFKFESMVYFFADERINKNLLGRTGLAGSRSVGLGRPSSYALSSCVRLRGRLERRGNISRRGTATASTNRRVIATRRVDGAARRGRVPAGFEGRCSTVRRRSPVR